MYEGWYCGRYYCVWGACVAGAAADVAVGGVAGSSCFLGFFLRFLRDNVGSLHSMVAWRELGP